MKTVLFIKAGGLLGPIERIRFLIQMKKKQLCQSIMVCVGGQNEGEPYHVIIEHSESDSEAFLFYDIHYMAVQKKMFFPLFTQCKCLGPSKLLQSEEFRFSLSRHFPNILRTFLHRFGK